MNRHYLILLYYLDLIIKEHTKDKEFISYLKKTETNLPVLYVSVYLF